jgi:hypothetical protein
MRNRLRLRLLTVALLLALGPWVGAGPAPRRAHADADAPAPAFELIAHAGDGDWPREPYRIGFAGQGVRLSMRTGACDPTAQLPALVAEGWDVWYVAASSDYPAYCNKPLAVSLADAATAIANPHVRGFYTHETLTLGCATAGWDAHLAASRFDWAYYDQLVGLARKYGKQLIWAEPVCWEGVLASPDAARYLPQWRGVVVIMWSCNFDYGRWGQFEGDALRVADRYGLDYGFGGQDWCLTVPQNEPALPATADTVEWLYLEHAVGRAARLAMVEAYTDRHPWYVEGARRYAAWLNSAP